MSRKFDTALKERQIAQNNLRLACHRLKKELPPTEEENIREQGAKDATRVVDEVLIDVEEPARKRV